jgi:hypothetical protein
MSRLAKGSHDHVSRSAIYRSTILMEPLETIQGARSSEDRGIKTRIEVLRNSTIFSTRISELRHSDQRLCLNDS